MLAVTGAQTCADWGFTPGQSLAQTRAGAYLLCMPRCLQLCRERSNARLSIGGPEHSCFCGLGGPLQLILQERAAGGGSARPRRLGLARADLAPCKSSASGYKASALYTTLSATASTREVIHA